MSEYIEREAALKSIKETIIGASEFANDIRIAAMNAVNSTPTTDVQEVVYCQECKHYRTGTAMNVYCDGKPVRYCSCDKMGRAMTDYDFCSQGAKMDEE